MCVSTCMSKIGRESERKREYVCVAVCKRGWVSGLDIHLSQTQGNLAQFCKLSKKDAILTLLSLSLLPVHAGS